MVMGAEKFLENTQSFVFNHPIETKGMDRLMKILAVIPARGGSKGIPRKNVRLMAGKPLIAYAIQNAKSCPLIADTVVTTDDEEALSIAKIYGADAIARRPGLAGDDVTLDPVVYDALLQMEGKNACTYDAVVTLQATSPLLKASTLTHALEEFQKDGKDTYISASNQAHLSWGKEGGRYFPNYQERKNRQSLPPHYVEAGAFLITRRRCISAGSRIGASVSIYEIGEEEAVDIDTPRDWAICEHALCKKRVVFRADGYRKLGMGHIYHCLTLAYRMAGHEIMFVTKHSCREGYERLKDSHFPVHAIGEEEEFYAFLEGWRPDVVVNDCLNTTKEHILRLKGLAGKVVTIEDLGEGAYYADAVVNALYHEENPSPNRFVGADYVCIRDEFLIHKPKKFSEEARNVLVMFGGTDPSNLTGKIYGMAEKLLMCLKGQEPGALPETEENPQAKNQEPGTGGSVRGTMPEIHFIIGKGYPAAENGISTKAGKNIFIHTDVKNVAEYMEQADLAFTSQGRTVFELAAMGVPAIVLAQNEREQLHTFAQMGNGFLNLGLGREATEETILSTFRWLARTPQIRKEMRELMLKNHLEKGTERVLDIILKDR